MSVRQGARLFVVAALAGASLLASGAGAGASSSGRAAFVHHADNICQPQRNDAKRRIANGVRLLTKKHPRIQAAGREFVRAYRELRTGYRRVGHLHRPRGDRKRIARWLRRERMATAAGVRSAKALRRHKFAKARKLQHRSSELEEQAQRAVRNFDFKHCRPI